MKAIPIQFSGQIRIPNVIDLRDASQWWLRDAIVSLLWLLISKLNISNLNFILKFNLRSFVERNIITSSPRGVSVEVVDEVVVLGDRPNIREVALSPATFDNSPVIAVKTKHNELKQIQWNRIGWKVEILPARNRSHLWILFICKRNKFVNIIYEDKTFFEQ